MSIAVIGAFGQLGSDLVPILGDGTVSLGHADIELANSESVTASLDGVRPDYVVNCAAYNLVDRAEDEPDKAYQVNALGPRNLARWCSANNVPLMHISTDYVFGLDDGRGKPRTEIDVPGPVSSYGTSKLAGEYYVRSLCPRHVVVRTCGLYGHRAARGKGNFVETMLRLGRERPELRIVADQRCTPTSTADLARVLKTLIDRQATGLFHATNAGSCSWYEFACEIFRLAKLNVKTIPIPAAEYGAKARRPDFSVLDLTKVEGVIGSAIPRWQDALQRYLLDYDHT